MVRPTLVYGPGDSYQHKMFRAISHDQFRMIGNGDNLVHPVYIDDFVEGMILAYQSDNSPGRVYIIGGDKSLPLREWLDIITREAYSSIPVINYPYLPMKALSAACEKVFRFFNMAPPNLGRRIDFFVKNRAYNIDRAMAELGYQPKVNLIEGARRTLTGYKDQGLI